MASLTVASINEKVHFSGSNIKQALKECEKKLQKRPKDPYLLYWRAAVHLKFGRDDEAFQQLEQLCECTPPVADQELLRAIYFRLGERESTRDKRKALWQNAFKAANDGNVLVTWFESAASMDDWQDAQVAMVTLKNKYPKDEQYVFALPAVQQLAADTLDGKDERNSKFMRMFASKALSMAVSKAMKGDRSVDAVTTRRELRLVLQIYRKQGMRKEILEILDHPIVGIFSPLVVCDLGFVRVKLEVLEEANMWQELWDCCVAALKQTHDHDEASKISYSLWPQDYAPWRALHLSYRELVSQSASGPGRMDELTKNLEEIYDKYAETNLRVQLLPKASTTSKDNEELFKNCCAYVAVFAKEQCCFDDISPYLERMDDDHQSKFLDWCSGLSSEQDTTIGEGSPKQQSQSLRAKANALKIQYQLSISKGQQAPKEQLEDFVVKALGTHQMARGKDVATCEDACALAVMALVRLFYVESSQGYLIQAEAVVKELLSHSEDSRKAGLLQARLVTFMGNFSAGMDVWAGLKIKEVLLETLSHHMFTRTAITHPQYYRSKLGGRANQDPLTQLDRALQTADKILQTLQVFLGADLDALQYDRLLEIQELKKNLSKSMSRKMWVIERRRIMRLRGEPVDELYSEVLDDNLEDAVDNRDLKRMWNYEHSSAPRFEDSISSGPTPGKYWLALHLLIDDTCTVISSPDSHTRIAAIDAVEKMANNPTDQDLAEQLTPAEKAIIPGWVKLRALASKALFGSGIESIGDDVNDLTTWLTQLLQHVQPAAAAAADSSSLDAAMAALSISPSSPSKPLLALQPLVQPLLLVLELLQAVARLCDAASRVQKNKSQKWWQRIPAKELGALRTGVVQDVFAAVRSRALAWTNELSDGGAVDALVERASGEGKTGEKIGEVLGEGKEEVWRDVVGVAVQGGCDALDGVARIKLA